MSRKRHKPMDWLLYFFVRVLVCIIQTLRMETCQTVCRGLAYLANDVLRVRQRITDENLRHAYPDWSEQQRLQFSRRMWEHLLLMLCEIAHTPRKIHENNFNEYIRFANRRTLVRQLLDPRPLVMVTGHFGNFELAGYVAGVLGFPSFTVVRELDNAYLNAWVHRFRSLHGQFILPKHGSAPLVQRALDAGAALGILADQHAGDKGVWVPFLGRPASCHKAVALFTLTSKAPQMVISMRRLGKPMQFEIACHGIADPETLDESLHGVKPLTKWYNDRLAEAVRLAPEQYWWLHRRWRPQPQRARKSVSRAA